MTTTYRITQTTTGVILDELDAATPLDAYRAHMARVGYPTEERAQSAGYTLAEIPADLAVEEVEEECYPIEIAKYGSVGIRADAAACGVTHMREIGRGHSDGNDDNPNSRVIFFELDNGTRVAATNGDPVWEEDDIAVSRELADDCGVALGATA